MTWRSFFGRTLFTIVAMLASSWVSGATLYGVQSAGSSGQLITIDSATAAPTVMGATSSQIDGIAFAPDGTLYATDNTAEQLVTLNPATGSVVSVIGPFGTADVVEGLAVRPSDSVLFGIDNATGSQSNLCTLDTTTGAVTIIGPFAAGVQFGMAGMAFNLDGSELYVIGHTSGCLFSVNQSTGTATQIGCGAGGASGGPLGMARDPVTGVLYVAEYWGGRPPPSWPPCPWRMARAPPSDPLPASPRSRACRSTRRYPSSSWDSRSSRVRSSRWVGPGHDFNRGRVESYATHAGKSCDMKSLASFARRG